MANNGVFSNEEFLSTLGCLFARYDSLRFGTQFSPTGVSVHNMGRSTVYNADSISTAIYTAMDDILNVKMVPPVGFGMGIEAFLKGMEGAAKRKKLAFWPSVQLDMDRRAHWTCAPYSVRIALNNVNTQGRPMHGVSTVLLQSSDIEAICAIDEKFRDENYLRREVNLIIGTDRFRKEEIKRVQQVPS